jgi:hypothetical protein
VGVNVDGADTKHHLASGYDRNWDEVVHIVSAARASEGDEGDVEVETGGLPDSLTEDGIDSEHHLASGCDL